MRIASRFWFGVGVALCAATAVAGAAPGDSPGDQPPAAPSLPHPQVSGPTFPGAPARPVAGDSQAARTAPAGARPPVEQVKPLWSRRTIAVVDVLDKEDGAVSRLKVPVGTTVRQGHLVVQVGACMVRPPTMAPDAALYITVYPSRRRPARPVSAPNGSAGDGPLFRGWLIRSEPGATVVGNAAVTFRLIGCTGR